MDNTKNGVTNLYEGMIKVATPMDVAGVHYDKGDTILYFDTIQEVLFQEVKSTADATGGFDNRSLVHWEYTREVQTSLRVGTISKLGVGLMNMNKMVVRDAPKLIPQIERHLVLNNTIKVKHPIDTAQKVSIYKYINGSPTMKILDYTINGDTIILRDTNIEVLVDYWFSYSDIRETIEIGNKDLNGYLMFTGKFRYVNEYTGQNRTGLIEIPQMRIDSNFSIILGRNASPLISVLSFVAMPIGDRGHQKSVEITYLDSDIDGD